MSRVRCSRSCSCSCSCSTRTWTAHVHVRELRRCVRSCWCSGEHSVCSCFHVRNQTCLLIFRGWKHKKTWKSKKSMWRWSKIGSPVRFQSFPLSFYYFLMFFEVSVFFQVLFPSLASTLVGVDSDDNEALSISSVDIIFENDGSQPGNWFNKRTRDARIDVGGAKIDGALVQGRTNYSNMAWHTILAYYSYYSEYYYDYYC